MQQILNDIVASLVDIGINAVPGPDGSTRLVGDVDTASVLPLVEAVSPVPGGVGPITDVWLIGNTLAAAAMAQQVEPRFGLFH